ncbi:MAG: NosD domain-containing protein, partial [Anaerolineae bacterium]
DIWYYGGEPVEIILLIRVEDYRRQIGDYVGDQLEDLGFTVVRDYKTSGEASPIWLQSDPADGLFHIYTGGWNSSEVARDLSDNFAFFYTNMGMGYPLWQAYMNTPEFYDLASRLRAHDFASLQERHAMMSQALEWALEDSARVWLQDNESVTPRRSEVSYTSDLYGGIVGSWLWPHTLERTGSFTTPLSIGSPSILLQPWNPLNSNTWVYDMMLIRATSDNGLIPDPYTGLTWPQRIEEAEVVVQEGLPVFKTLDWVNLQFAPSIEVPDDAWVDWDATTQRFLTAAEVYTETQTALRKSVVYYPIDLYSTVTWHDGSHFSIADVVMNMILTFDRYKEASPVYDPTEMERYDNFMATFKGVRIVSENPLIIETYSDDYQLDAEKGITTWWPFYVKGPGAWHNLALGLLAEEAGTGAFSLGKANDSGVPQLDYVAWPGIAPLEEQLAAAQAGNVIPYAPTLGRYITPAAATARWNNLANWHAAHGHFWIGTGPLYLEQVHPIFGELSLKYYPAYPDAPDRWADFAEPAIPEVSVTGPDGVVLGDEAAFNIGITFNGQPYPNADIEGVYYMVVDSQNQLRFNGDAMPVDTTNGLWRVILDADMTGQLSSGTNNLEIVVASKQVAVPSFTIHTFTDVEPCYVRVSSLPGVTYHDLQTAVDAAQPGDTLKVAGTCTTVHSCPRRDLTTTGVVTQVAYIDKSITLQGGYTTTNWLTPSPLANSTTLDALGQGRVFYITGGINPTIKGLHITGGDATGLDGGLNGLDGEWDAGGGLYVITATATIRDNWIFGNTAGVTMSVGGGVHLESSNATVTKNKISSNSASFGGGIQAYATSGTLSGNTVMSNTVSLGGGGMCLWGGDNVTGNIVIGNTSEGNGGGIWLGSTGENKLTNNVSVNNYAAGSGSGLYIDAPSQLRHTTVANNTGGDGSGIYVTEGLSLISVGFTNTIIS